MGACVSFNHKSINKIHEQKLQRSHNHTFPFNSVFELRVYRLRPGTSLQTQLSGTCFSLRTFGLSEADCVVTAAHNFISSKDEVNFGPVEKLEILLNNEKFVVLDPSVGDFFVHQQYDPEQPCSPYDIAVVRFSAFSSPGHLKLSTVLEGRSLTLSKKGALAGDLIRIIGKALHCTGVLHPLHENGTMILQQPQAGGSSGGPWLDTNNSVVAVHTGGIGFMAHTQKYESVASKGARLDKVVLNATHVFDF
jgi:hypothetical protein